MAIRIPCPSCNTPNLVDEAKRGTKVRCRSCKEPFSVPAKKNTTAIQAGSKPKAKAPLRKSASDEDDDKPTPKKGGMGMLLVIGGVAVGLLFLLCGGVGLGGWFALRSWSAKADDAIHVAKNDANKAADPKEDNGGNVPDPKKNDPNPKQDPNPKTSKNDPDPKNDGDPKFDPNPKQDPGPGPIPEPEPKKKKKKSDPMPEPEPVAKADPLPPALEKVRQATVQVRALRPDGKWIEGSGFVVQPGVIVTNAHVLGMLDPKESPPNNLEVVFDAGTPNERKIGAGYVVDPSVDLAILQVVKTFKLPPPLSADDSSKLAPAQKVHVFGFPGPSKDRKPATVKETVVVNVKKDGAGAVELIQVAGGMSPGSSGGPIVNPDGNVVGVCLGVVTGTEMHLAIPPEMIDRILLGKLGTGYFGNTRALPGSRTVISYHVPLIDPLDKIKDVSVEVWTGSPTAGRGYSYQQPLQVPGDSARMTESLIKQGAFASSEITVPSSMPVGQAVWVQPVIALKDGSRQWGVALAMPLPKSEYERKVVNLTPAFDKPKERTASLKYTLKGSAPNGGQQISFKSAADILEVMTPHPEGGLMKTAFGGISAEIEAGGKSQAYPKEFLDLIRTVPVNYGFDPTGKVKGRDYRQLPGTVGKEAQEQVFAILLQMNAMYEMTMAPMPNKEAETGDKWISTLPVVLRTKQKTGVVEASLSNTYRGVQITGNRREAIIAITGKLRATDPELKQFDGDITGKIGFDYIAGYISSADLKIVSVANAAEMDRYTLDIELKRITGNPLKIQVPQDSIAKGDPIGDPKGGKAKTVLDKRAALNGFDPFDPGLSTPKKKAHYQKFNVTLEANKTYLIQLSTTSFTPIIRMQAPSNQFVGQVAGGQLPFRPTVSGVFHVYVIAGDGRTGGFHLVVNEQPAK